jgi:phage baseplate assembly protein gpV
VTTPDERTTARAQIMHDVWLPIVRAQRAREKAAAERSLPSLAEQVLVLSDKERTHADAESTDRSPDCCR